MPNTACTSADIWRYRKCKRGGNDLYFIRATNKRKGLVWLARYANRGLPAVENSLYDGYKPHEIHRGNVIIARREER